MPSGGTPLLVLARVVGPVLLCRVVVVVGVAVVVRVVLPAMGIFFGVPVGCHVMLVVKKGEGSGGHNGKRNNNNY